MKSGLPATALFVRLFVGAVPFVLAADSASSADQVFVAKVSQGGMYEVEASKVAEEKAVAQDVKDIASAEVHDHELVNHKLKDISGSAGIKLSAQLNSEFQQRLGKLKSVSDASFDAAYISDMQQIHGKDEKLFAKEATEGSGAFKPFAAETDLIVRRHIGALNAK